MSGPLRERFRVVVTSAADGVALLAVNGELDFGNSGELREALCAGLATSGTRALIADLSELEFIDSSGIYELVHAARAAESQGAQLVLASATANVARVFSMVRLGDVLAIEESVDAALLRVGAN